MKPTQEILERIRDLAGLKRLEFGALVKYEKDLYRCLGSTGMMTDIHQGCYPYFHFKMVGGYDVKQMHSTYNFEIIGLPVQLNDLLRVIGDAGELCTRGRYLLIHFNKKDIRYDLALTVEQNLETNPDLRSLISNLIF